MINTIDLEKRWLRYKIKSFIPYLLLIIVLILIFSMLYIQSSSLNTKKETGHEKQTVQKKQPLNEKKIIPKEKPILFVEQKVKRKQETKNKDITPPEPALLILKPSLDFLKNMHFQTSKIKVKKIIPLPIVEQESNVTTKKNTTTKKSNNITIVKNKTKNDIEDVIKRFKQSNSPALSLFVAKKYYELGDYKNAYNYALITNKIDNTVDDSWIIFTKSLVKLNKKDFAIQTLKKYINDSSSNNAKILLEKIQSGIFQ